MRQTPDTLNEMHCTRVYESFGRYCCVLARGTGRSFDLPWTVILVLAPWGGALFAAHEPEAHNSVVEPRVPSPRVLRTDVVQPVDECEGRCQFVSPRPLELNTCTYACRVIFSPFLITYGSSVKRHLVILTT